MTWKKFCAVIPSPIILVTCGMIAFAFGYQSSQSSTFPKPLKDLLAWSEPLLELPIPYAEDVGLLAVSILLGSKAIATKTNELANEQTAKQVKEEVRISLDNYLRLYQEQYRNDLENLRQEVDILCGSMSSDKQREIEYLLDNIQSINWRFNKTLEELEKVEEWFNLGNKQQMINHALKSLPRLKLKREQRRAFEQDIRNCVDWIYFSFIEPIYRDLTPEKHASTMQLLSNSFFLYEKSLKTAVAYMKAELEKKVDLGDIDVESRLEELLRGLEKISESTVMTNLSRENKDLLHPTHPQNV
ncbi:hypothetical protein H6G89_10535 [Oscillatoria sp. FACHB-1407]|uniref:hypothetical protein n=1 Tax=Oscillatoria sp. FACHB-1407 TaxID=2692847 RepID=UPI001688AC7F|nr:hypothetical protein [Oscillatoria sp. FACHB-1407]MBD2461485.1 hypothetical protein [Oscillatoria sp. FACHB-1407]